MFAIYTKSLCVPRYRFQTCSNCEVQHPYVLLPLQTMCPKVHALQVGRPKGHFCYYLYTAPLTHHGSCPVFPSTVHQDTHCMRVCPTAPYIPTPCIPEGEEGVPGAGRSPIVHAEKSQGEESYLLVPSHKREGMEHVISPLRP